MVFPGLWWLPVSAAVRTWTLPFPRKSSRNQEKRAGRLSLSNCIDVIYSLEGLCAIFDGVSLGISKGFDSKGDHWFESRLLRHLIIVM
jgi:hypothetical protein